MDAGPAPFCQHQMRIVHVRCVVYGIRYRIDLHFPLLASSGNHLNIQVNLMNNFIVRTGLRRNLHGVRYGLCGQSYLGDVGLFPQLPVDP